MFIDEVTLDPKGWYIKVLKYVLPNYRIGDNFCPIFWLTGLCLILFPFKYGGIKLGQGIAVFITLLIAPFVAFEKSINAYFYDKELSWLDSIPRQDIERARYLHDSNRNDWTWSMPKSLDKCEVERLEKLWQVLQKKSNKSDKFYEKYKEIKQGFTYNEAKEWLKTWSKIDEETAAEREAKRKEQYRRDAEQAERRRIFEAKKRAFYNNLIKVSKYVSPVIFGAIGLVVSYYAIFVLGWLLYWIMYAIDKINWVKFFTDFGIDTGIVIGACAVVYGIIWGLGKLIKLIANNYVPSTRPCRFCEFMTRVVIKIGEGFEWFFNGIGEGFEWFFNGIGAVCSFFWMGMKTFKSDNCPHVNWKAKE